MATHEERWFEVWYAEGDVAPDYLLIVTSDVGNDGRVAVLDPYKEGKIVYEGNDYDDARSWLLEDDYSLVRGREHPDDGW
jgi:hypothetical protein